MFQNTDKSNSLSSVYYTNPVKQLKSIFSSQPI